MSNACLPKHSWMCVVQYSAASFIETMNSSSLTMDSDEFVARMIAAGVPDIEAASTQPLSPKLKADPTPASPKAGATLIPSAPEDNLGSQPSQTSLASKHFDALHTNCSFGIQMHLHVLQGAEAWCQSLYWLGSVCLIHGLTTFAAYAAYSLVEGVEARACVKPSL